MGTASEANEASAAQLSRTSYRIQNLCYGPAMCIFSMCSLHQGMASHVFPGAIPQPGLEDVVLSSVPLDQPGLTQSHMGNFPKSQVDSI